MKVKVFKVSLIGISIPHVLSTIYNDLFLITPSFYIAQLFSSNHSLEFISLFIIPVSQNCTAVQGVLKYIRGRCISITLPIEILKAVDY